MMKKTAKEEAGNKILSALLADKSLKPKAKVAQIAGLLLKETVSSRSLVGLATAENDRNKGTLIEAMELASKTQSGIIEETAFEFVTQSLASPAPRVKWESARLIANTAHLFKNKLKAPVVHLLKNTEEPGNVVRWSAALALVAIANCDTSLNRQLIPALTKIMAKEQDNAIVKIYRRILPGNKTGKSNTIK